MCVSMCAHICMFGIELGLHARPLSHSLQRLLFIFSLTAVATLSRFLCSAYSIEIPSVLTVGYILPFDLIYYSQSSHLS